MNGEQLGVKTVSLDRVQWLLSSEVDLVLRTTV